jgi:Ca-activated chloride channel family protein
MFDGFYFEHPKFFFVIFFFIACASLCRMKLPSFYFPHSQSFAKDTVSRSNLLFMLKWISIVMLIFAFMSPVKDQPYEMAPKEGYAIALILDTSDSMSMHGFDRGNVDATKFDAVKSIVKDFIAKRFDDNIGVVVFGAYSFIASPLTYDKNIVQKVVDQLYISIAGQSTALYDSLAQGVDLLKNSKAKTKIAILLTDGYNSAEATKIPLHVALELAQKEKVKVYTIGIGNDGEFDQALLTQIASSTGGKTYSAADASELKSIYNDIDKLEKSKIKSQNFSDVQYFYFYPLFFGVLSLMLYVYLINKRGHE